MACSLVNPWTSPLSLSLKPLRLPTCREWYALLSVPPSFISWRNQITTSIVFPTFNIIKGKNPRIGHQLATLLLTSSSPVPAPHYYYNFHLWSDTEKQWPHSTLLSWTRLQNSWYNDLKKNKKRRFFLPAIFPPNPVNRPGVVCRRHARQCGPL